MSLVGTRPILPDELEQYELHHRARIAIKPGITDPIPYEQPLNIIPAATERNNLSVAEPMKLSVGSFHLTIPNGTDPQLLAQTLRIVKELEC